jgi:hypothetical protein
MHTARARHRHQLQLRHVATQCGHTVWPLTHTRTLEMPKSPSFTRLCCAVSSTLLALTSRWMTPSACTCASAASSCTK